MYVRTHDLFGEGERGISEKPSWLPSLSSVPDSTDLGQSKGVRIREQQVKRLVKAKVPDLYALIEKIRIPCLTHKGRCRFQTVRREVIDGKEHEWTVAVTGDIGQLRARVSPLLPGMTIGFAPRRKSIGGKTILSHSILLFVNPNYRFRWTGLEKQIPDKQKRVEFLFAEGLVHELVHATISVERTLPAGRAHTRTYIEFGRTWRTANSGRLSTEREAVIQAILNLIAFSGSPHAHAAAEARRQFEFLINEKVAAQTASVAFGRPSTNREIANAYSEVVANKILDGGTPSVDERTWKIRVGQLAKALVDLYASIDAYVAVPEIIRRNHIGPIIQRAPAIDKLE